MMGRPLARARRARRLIAAVVLAHPAVRPDVYIERSSPGPPSTGSSPLSMNVLVGYTGQASLGHAAFLGVGAFASGYALTELGMPFGAAAGGGRASSAWPSALVLGGVALRVTGLYLALVTIAFGLFAQETLFNIRSLTGGGAGQPAARPSIVSTDLRYAYFCIGVLGARAPLRLAAHRRPGPAGPSRRCATTSGSRPRGASTSPATSSSPS